VVIPGTIASSEGGMALAVHVWRNVNEDNPLDVALQSQTSTSTVIPPFSSITPQTQGSIILAVGGGQQRFGQGGDLYSSNLSNFFTASVTANYSPKIGIGSANWTSGSYTPTPWTFAGTNSSSSSIAALLALSPRFNRETQINFTNIPSFYKEISIISKLSDSVNNKRYLSWSENFTRLISPAATLASGQSFYYKFNAQNGSLFLTESIGAPKIQKVDKITATGTWTAPGDVDKIEILLCGGGGGGYGGSGDETGGSGSVITEVLEVSPGLTYSVVIGAGGVGGDPRTSGSASSFGDFSISGGTRGASQEGALVPPSGFGGWAGSTLLWDGVDGFGRGGRIAAGYSPPINSGSGGSGSGNSATATNGSSGVAIIKYWTAT
jgi:hypothetical protein